MSHAKHVTRDNRKNPEYHAVAAARKLRTDTNLSRRKSWPNHVKIEQHIGSEKTYGPKNTGQFNMMVHFFFAVLCTIMLNYKRYRGYRLREDMNFMFEWQEQYLMSKRSELRVR